MVKNSKQVAFAADTDLPDYPVVIIDSRILIALWSKDRAYLTSITSDGRYELEKIESDYARLIDRQEPLKIAFINVADRASKDHHISFNDGRHTVRYLLDNCDATQIPVMLDQNGARFLLSRNYARALTPDEDHVMRAHNRNNDALRLIHRAYEIMAESGQQPTPENLSATLEEYYRTHDYYEYLVPLATIKDYFRPFTQLREPINWQSSTINILPSERGGIKSLMLY